MVVEKGCIKRISTIKQIIDGLNLCNGNNDSCLEQEHCCHYSDRIVFTLPHTHIHQTTIFFTLAGLCNIRKLLYISVFIL